MIKNYTTVLAILIATLVHSQNLNSEWVRGIGGTDSEIGHAICTDSDGNVYSTGMFRGTVDFDPGPATYYLTSQGEEDAFVLKLDPVGNFIWAKQMGSTDKDSGDGILVDNDGNIYVTGSFVGTVDFDPGVGLNDLSSTGNSDIFVQKLNSDGSLLWVKQIGGTGYEFGISTLDKDGEYIYTTGSYVGTIDLNPNAGTHEETSSGQTDIFIQKLDLDGNFIWAKSMGGSNVDYSNSLVLDGNGDLCLTGGFNGVADFDPDAGVYNLTSEGFSDIFVQKLDTSGSLIWAKQMGSTTWDQGRSIATDSSGSMYITGSFGESVDFDPSSGTQTMTSLGSADIFVLKLDTNGDFEWVKQMGGMEFDEGMSIQITPNGNVLSAGRFNDSGEFDPSSNTNIFTSQGHSDIYIQLLNSDGDYFWAEQIGGSFFDLLSDLHVDSYGDAYTIGRFGTTVDFSPFSSTNDVLNANGEDDIFLQKLNVGETGLSAIDLLDEVAVYPNPVENTLFIDLNTILRDVRVHIVNAQGRIVHSSEYTDTDTINFDFNAPSGIYFLKIESSKGSTCFKLIKK